MGDVARGTVTPCTQSHGQGNWERSTGCGADCTGVVFAASCDLLRAYRVGEEWVGVLVCAEHRDGDGTATQRSSGDPAGADSPELLAGYPILWDLFAKTKLTPHEQQVVYMTSNFENECHYCMAGHTALAKMRKMDTAVVNALRDGTKIIDPKVEALLHFTTLVVRNRGWVSETDIDAFLAAGYTRRNVLDVILGVATEIHEQLHKLYRTYRARQVHAR